MKNKLNLINLLSVLIGIAINIFIASARQLQNTFISLSIFLLSVILALIIIRIYLKKINPYFVLVGLLVFEILGFIINPKAWLLLLSEIIIISAGCFYIVKLSTLKKVQQILYPILMIVTIFLIAFVIEPQIFLAKKTINISKDSTFFSKTIYSKIKLQDKKMNTIDLSIFNNKVVLFDFWFKGCKPCKIKENALGKLADIFKYDSSLLIVAINPGTINSFKEYSEYNFKSSAILSLYDSSGVFSEFNNIKDFPTEFLINKRGVIEHRIEGFIENSDIIYIKNLQTKISTCLQN